MSQEIQLIQVAKHLANLLNVKITSSPAQPSLIIEALKMLIQDADDFFSQLCSIKDEQQQWNQIISFIQTYILQDGTQFGFQSLDTPQIIQIYHIIIQLVEDAIQSNQRQNEQSRKNQKMINSNKASDRQSSKNINQLSKQNINQQLRQNINEAFSQSSSINQNQSIQNNQTPSELSDQIPLIDNVAQNVKNNSQLNYIQGLKKQKKLKKHQSNKQLQAKNKQKIKKNIPLQNQKQQPKRNILNQNHLKSLNQPNSKKSHHQSINKFQYAQTNPKSSIKRNKKTNDQIQSKIQTFNKNHNHQIMQKIDQKQKSKTAKTSQKNHLSKKVKSKSLIKNLEQKISQKVKKQRENMNQPLQQIVMKTVKQAFALNKSERKKSEKKANFLMRDKGTSQMIQKAKLRYKYELKNKNREEKIGNKIGSEVLLKRNKDDYSKLLKNRQRKMENQILNQQLKYYYQLRDKKIGYIKHMHLLIEKLEKQRHLDLRKKQSQIDKKHKGKIKQKIQQTDHLFQQNMLVLREKFREQRENKMIRNDGCVQILRQIEKNMSKNQKDQIKLMKTLWQQEKTKLQLIQKDQQNIKSKLQNIYRKNMP